MKVAIILFALALTRAQDTTYNCNGWSQFTIGSYLVENNVWGQGDITDFTQCIYPVSYTHLTLPTILLV